MVEVRPTSSNEGSLNLRATVPGSIGTYMNAIFIREVGELYIMAYAVDLALQGCRFSGKLFDATIQAATDHGDVRVIRGIPSGPNLEVLTGNDGRIVAENIARTPWAKVLSDLGYDTILREGLMESRRKDSI